MNVLTVCHNGILRSRILAEYLMEKGYNTQFCGVNEHSDNYITQQKVDFADIIIVLEKQWKDYITTRLEVGNKKIIELDISEDPEVYGKEAVKLYKKDSHEFYHKYLFEKMKKQMKKYLPLE
ncbi:hypothetical protein KY321_04920 [Candidatus Woesearchaeota archaeon]|nr:hypothetical protein [Candidatus Woesearchaeota archaeon]